MDPEARDRVLAAIDGDKKRGETKRSKGGLLNRRGVLPLLLMIAVALVAVGLLGRRIGGSDQGSVMVNAARGATADGRMVHAGRGLPEGRIAVENGGEVSLALSGATMTIAGPAEFQSRAEGVTLFSGGADARGQVLIEASGCEARLDGDAHFERFASYLSVQVTDGDVQFNRDDVCRRSTDGEGG